ncbi:A disintegrin and metalloproteinase with thrombospondin motifs adt-2-like [Eriocheir sinensis]|uniref:A disintegrin and metalloproteinase with thrombospondin motifs adt-2-like n=1 Tax=Eriocheir sinensis TaxID=95602 RepID=UPI0021C9C67C|nr:A disintegrin and metalloproteinase with thrombospondin motifs adt-2-like [Eriocheir sinensis]
MVVRGRRAAGALCLLLLLGRSHGLLQNGAFSFSSSPSPVLLSREDLKLLFVNPDDVANHHVVRLHSRSREKRASPGLTENPGHLDVTLEDGGRELEFELRPNDQLISPEFVVVVRGYDGVSRERGAARTACVFSGFAKGQPDITAALSDCDGRGFTGVIISGNETHMVTPHPGTRRRRRRREAEGGGSGGEAEDDDEVTPDGLHIIHARKKNMKCGVFDLEAMKAPRVLVRLPKNERGRRNETSEEDEEDEYGRTKRETKEELRIETAVFVDDEMVTFIKERYENQDVKETITDTVFAIMNGVALMYQAPSLEQHLIITVVKLEIIEDSKRGPSKANGNIQQYLNNFCSWQKNQKGKMQENWDHALMLSGLDLWDGDPESTSVIGLAWVAGMCQPTYSCTINEGTSFESVFVITHELGHNLGMSHDGSRDDRNTCSGDKFLMSSSTGPGKVTWSSCSNQELKSFLRKYPLDCLETTSKLTPKGSTTGDQLPGEVYVKEEQCNFAQGSGFKPYVTSKAPYDDVCRELWCQNTTHALRTHPALEGTTCGVKKFCMNGSCQNKPARTIAELPTTVPTVTTRAPRKESKGFSNLLWRIRNLFKRYMSLRQDLPASVFKSSWRLKDSSHCSASCGGGWSKGEVSCTTPDGRVRLGEDMCNPDARPIEWSSCNTGPCGSPEGTAGISSGGGGSGGGINFPSG